MNAGLHTPLGGKRATGTSVDRFVQAKKPPVGLVTAVGGDVHRRDCIAT